MVQSSFLDPVSHSPTCPEPPSTFVLNDLPSDNYLYSDCNAAEYVVVMSPFPDNDFAQVRPRLIVAWPRQQERLVRLLCSAEWCQRQS
ncbi:hypothetical protein BDV33DRAFT_207234 [Aspergillus novoparasiticus]|uniref:Uncharacterized protein n=1 Tax=Aspergillus novoparasiticus TaxID=986946 RepID=A0A5N6EG50_9EURO|nr:hypothetical protein BDV33DRAFT_207234 [Aspergillus novoparasiticus]